MKRLFLVSCISLLVIQLSAQTNSITKRKFHDGQFNQQDTTAGYAEAVLVDNVLYISGAVSKGSFSDQLKNIYTDLGNILKAYGATFQNVVKETLYTTDIESVKSNNAVRKAFYNGDFPAATWVQISRLYSKRPDTQIEVELIAYLPKATHVK